MKKAPYMITLAIAIITLAIWGSTGFHTGWTQTSIPVTGIDDITGIEYTTYEDGFVAGVDLLGGGLGFAMAIGAITLGAQKWRSRR